MARPRARAPRTLARLGLVLAIVAATAGAAAAHPLAPGLLVVAEREGGVLDVTWRISRMRIPGTELRPVLPPACEAVAPAEVEEDRISITARWQVRCPAAGLVGRRLGVEGLAATETDVVLRVALADGRTMQSVLRAREPFHVVPARAQPLDVGRRYLALGVEHILTGWDHLLFVVGLLLLVRSVRALVATITAFTAGHSVTLTLAVLDLARVPSAPVEALIAASVFLLAVELARRDPSGASLMRRAPWAMAAGFGLLHGLGFAGALREVGLPSADVPLALLAFNLGIEVGQLAFVLAVLTVGRLGRPVLRRLPGWARRAPVYAMGSLAASWMIERTAALWP